MSSFVGVALHCDALWPIHRCAIVHSTNGYDIAEICQSCAFQQKWHLLWLTNEYPSLILNGKTSFKTFRQKRALENIGTNIRSKTGWIKADSMSLTRKSLACSVFNVQHSNNIVPVSNHCVDFSDQTNETKTKEENKFPELIITLFNCNFEFMSF